jgi:ribosome-binding protein aMBF1 (putative translation factor)
MMTKTCKKCQKVLCAGNTSGYCRSCGAAARMKARNADRRKREESGLSMEARGVLQECLQEGFSRADALDIARDFDAVIARERGE